MKKIINGRKYDTDTAKLVGTYWNGEVGFGYVREMLYRKKTGEFFLNGYGGPQTKYRKACGNNCWCEGETIIPMTEAEAKNWGEKSLESDEYEAIFGEVEE